MPIESDQKQKLIDKLVKAYSKSKYGEPFERGQIQTLNTRENKGTLHEYTSVVLAIVTADTLLSIDRKLDALLENSLQGTLQRFDTMTDALTTDIAFWCSECGQKMRINAAAAGQQVVCPKCDANLIVPRAKQCVNCAKIPASSESPSQM